MADRSVNGKRRSCCARSSSNGWSSAPVAATGWRRLRPRPRLAYAAEFTFVADGWQRSDGRLVRTTPAFFNALDQTRTRTVEHLAAGPRDPAPVVSSLAARSAGAFPAPRSAISPSDTHAVRSNMRLRRSAPFSTTPFTLTPYQDR
jgi:hypothetical protein